jgi:hypothetical protein
MRGKFTPCIIREISVHFQMNKWRKNATTTTLRTPYALQKYHYPAADKFLLVDSEIGLELDTLELDASS